MKQIVVLGTDLDTTMAYGVQHGASQMYFTFIGDENAEENIMRDEDRSKQLEKAGLRFTCIKSKQEPQDCYALVHADEVLLGIFKEQQDSYRDYLKAVLPMRAKTNAGQPLSIRYRKKHKAKVLYFMNELYQAMQEEETEWFHQMVNMQELV